jgi:hypothetical protein
MKYIKLKTLLVCVVSFLLSSCGGKTVTETVGGTISGLSSNLAVKLVLQNNGGDNLTPTGNGTFAFATAINVGSAYYVTVSTQPSGETCVVENPVGVVEQSIGSVNSVVVVCSVTLSVANDITGQVNNLTSGGQLTLLNNGTQSYLITGTGVAKQEFSFSLPQALNSTYSVVVQTNPTGQTCTLVNAAGTVTASGQVPTDYTDTTTGNTVVNTSGVVANITVTCQ